jgi:hypothetical protein
VRIGALERRFAPFRPQWAADPIEDEVIRGDGVRLAEVLQEGAPPPPWALRVASFTTRGAGSAALSTWLRWGTVAGCHGCDTGARFADVTARLALAEGIGDRAMVAELRAIAGAFRHALLRRETALPLLLLEQLGMKWVPPVDLALGDRHSCARFGDSTVRCWGSNDHGQLGGGAELRRLSPAAVPGLTDVAQLAAGGNETCARMKDGTVQCWGEREGAVAPTPIVGVRGAVRIAVGHALACAVLEGGTLSCWGPGRGDWLAGEAPRGLSVVEDVALGVEHACARRKDGTVWCWGSNASGQLGDDTPGGRREAAPVPGIAGALQVSAGYRHTCALLRSGEHDDVVKCWGAADDGQLGDGLPRSGETPLASVALWQPTALSLGNGFTCGLAGDVVACWGKNGYGQLGLGSSGPRTWPAYTTFCGVAQVAAGGAHACLRTKTGEIWCWGANRDGQVGDGTTLVHPAPVFVPL